jgi:dTDP-4-dehydrorhamnose 3,5-epimerase
MIGPAICRDDRGFVSETFAERTFSALGLCGPFVQENHAMSVAAGVVRGLHFQAPPHAQDKLVRVVRGSVLDVAVDIRHGSPTFGRHVSALLSAENWLQMWVPRGFAHGYCTLEPNTEVLYKVTDYFAPECDRGLRWDDPQLAIAWPVSAAAARLSPRDKRHPPLAELGIVFSYGPAAAAPGPLLETRQ